MKENWIYGRNEKISQCKSCVELKDNTTRKKTRLFQEAETGISIRRCRDCTEKVFIMVG